MDYGEAVRLIDVLSRDPSSQLAAAVNDWKHPASPEWLLLADVFDVFCRANFERPQPYPRPFPDPSEVRRGRTDLPRAEVIDLLNRHGHHLPEEE